MAVATLPTSAPQVQQPDASFTPNVPQDAFGATRAKGLEQLGGSLERVGERFGQIAADDVSNQFQEQANKLLHGDPNAMVTLPDGSQAPDLGYLGLKGSAALSQRQNYEKKLDDLLKQSRNALVTPNQVLQFDNFSRRYRAVVSSQMGTHADTQSNVYAEQVNRGSIKTQAATIAANPDDPDIVAHAASDLVNAHVKLAQNKGALPGDPAWIAAIADGKREAAEAQIASIGATDPVRAQRMTEDYKGILGPRYHVFADHFRNRAEEDGALSTGVDVFRAVTGRGASAGTSGPPNPNNIGNVRPTGGGANSGFVQVDNFDKGVALAVNNARAYPAAYNGGKPMSIDQIAQHWTENDKAAWAKNVAAGSGLPANEPLDLNSPQVAAKFARGVHMAEWGGAKGAVPVKPVADYLPGASGKVVPDTDEGGRRGLNAPPDLKEPEGQTEKFARQMQEGIDKIDSMNLPPKQYERTLRVFRESMATHQIATNLQEKAKTETYHKALGDYVSDMVTGNFDGMVQKINQDPRIPPEHKMQLIEMARHQSGQPIDPKTYGTGWLTATQGVLKNPGDEGYIGDATSVIKMGPAGTNQLTATGVQDVLRTMGQARKDIDQHGIQQSRASVMKWAESQMVVDHEMLYPGMPVRKDKKGEDAYNGSFVPKVNAAYAEFLKKPNANPIEFWTQENIQKLMEGVRSQKEIQEEKLRGAIEGAPPEDIKKVPIPPAPEGVNPSSWESIVRQPPLTTNGKVWPVKNWAAAVDRLRADPSPEMMEAFDKKFAASGHDAKSILEHLHKPPPAAPGGWSDFSKGQAIPGLYEPAGAR